MFITVWDAVPRVTPVGSLMEIETQALIARDLGYINSERTATLLQLAVEATACSTACSLHCRILERSQPLKVSIEAYVDCHRH
jgi:hypothetical protein